jgi:hypothetical protein
LGRPRKAEQRLERRAAICNANRYYHQSLGGQNHQRIKGTERLEESKKVAQQGGKVAKVALKELESKTGKK